MRWRRQNSSWLILCVSKKIFSKFHNPFTKTQSISLSLATLTSAPKLTRPTTQAHSTQERLRSLLASFLITGPPSTRLGIKPPLKINSHRWSPSIPSKSGNCRICLKKMLSTRNNWSYFRQRLIKQRNRATSYQRIASSFMCDRDTRFRDQSLTWIPRLVSTTLCPLSIWSKRAASCKWWTSSIKS